MSVACFVCYKKRERKEVASGGWKAREVKRYIYGILMADKEIKAEGFLLRSFFKSFWMGKPKTIK